MSTEESGSDLPEIDPSPKTPPMSAIAVTDRPAPPESPLGHLPRVSRRHARLAMRLGRAEAALRPLVDELLALLGTPLRLDQADLIARASGLRRPGAIAQLSWPRLNSRVALGIEPAVAHAIVDHLLGFERAEPEHKLQVSPVEWGVLGFVVARLLDRLASRPGPLGPWDLYIDRVGPEPFRPEGLGAILTIAWPIRIGPASGVVRLWVPEVLVALALVDDFPPPSVPTGALGRLGNLKADARVELGAICLSSGLGAVQTGAELPISGDPLRGTPEAPEGPVRLAIGDRSRLWIIPAVLRADSGDSQLVVAGPITPIATPQEATPVPPSTDSAATVRETGSSRGDIPATLIVELGRLSLPLSRLADLKPGDVLELGRDASEPVDLTSGGTLVARGELVQLDAGLGVRVHRVFV